MSDLNADDLDAELSKFEQELANLDSAPEVPSLTSTNGHTNLNSKPQPSSSSPSSTSNMQLHTSPAPSLNIDSIASYNIAASKLQHHEVIEHSSLSSKQEASNSSSSSRPVVATTSSLIKPRTLITKTAVIAAKANATPVITPNLKSTNLLNHKLKSSSSQLSSNTSSTLNHSSHSQSLNHAPLASNQALSSSAAAVPATSQSHPLHQRHHQILSPNQLPQKAHADDVNDANARKRQKVADPTLRVAAGHVWQDETLNEWPENDFRIFVGDLSVDVTDEMLTQCFSHLPSFAMARVVKDKKQNLGRGYGFVSFTNHEHGLRALKQMDGKYCFNRPMRLKKSSHEKRQAALPAKRSKFHR